MNKTFSKSTLIYLTPAVYRTAAKIAKKLGMSFNAYVRSLIDADIAARTAPKDEAKP